MKDTFLPGLPPIAAQIWDMKYRLKEADGTPIDLTVQDTWSRIAKALGDEPGFYDALEDFKFLPAGRITSGAGTARNVTLFNCFVNGKIPDNLSGIFDMLKEAALTMQQGGGIGYDFSTLRPKGALVKGVAADASGPLTFMDVWDSMCRTIMSAGSRRGAMMATMRCDHPDIEDFIAAKRDPLRLRKFNLSVLVTDQFMEAVKADHPWQLIWEGKVWKELPARDLWDQIMRATYDYAEPGVIFIDRINQLNPLNYCETISATNPCVPAGTPILTRQGWKAIDTLEGQDVDVWNGAEWSNVKVRETGRDQELVRVALSDGRSLVCTPAHRFVLPSGEKIAAADLEPNMPMMKTEWPVVTGGETQEKAWQQGFFSGDGWASSDRDRHYIALYGKKQALEHLFTDVVSRHVYEIAGGYEGTNTDADKVQLYFGSGAFASKDFVPDVSYSVQSRLNWFAGLCDADGVAVRDKHSTAVQVSSKDRAFLDRVQLLLNTLGVASSLSAMKDCWRLSVSASNVLRLQAIGFQTHRLDLSDNRPQREARRFSRVVSVLPIGRADKVWCFTEPERGMGCFNGILTGQCGEQPLPPYGACLLGSVNLARFVSNPFTEASSWDIQGLRRTVATAVRMMDNVIDVSKYPLPQQEAEAKNKRRIGLGTTGVADALAMLQVRYGTEEAAQIVEDIQKFIAHEAAWASVELAKEKGPFPLFDADKYCASSYVTQFDKDLQDAIREHGIRNSHLTSIAPTGTISMYAGNVSSGIEPIFGYSYDRKVTQKDGSKTTETVRDYAVELYGSDDLPDYFVSVADLKPEDHVRMQAAAQKWVDSSISKTVNLPEDIDFEDFKAVYLDAYEKGCKGCTTYRPNEITGSVLSSTPSSTKVDAGKVLIAGTPVDTKPAPRGDVLEGKTYRLKWPGMPHTFWVTINDGEDGQPHEIFVSTQNVEAQPWIAALTRMISAVFRRGGDLNFIHQELQQIHDPKGGAWVNGAYVPSLVAAIGGVVAAHMGTAPATGEACPSCGERTLVKASGCETCQSCGHSKCS